MNTPRQMSPRPQAGHAARLAPRLARRLAPGFAPGFVLALGVLAGVAVPALAGDTDPPPGPVGSTMKDLDDVSPRQAIRNDFDSLTPIVISSSGSYYLAENIDAFFGQHGIEITVGDVTLDLNGFRVLGNTEVGSLDGIHLSDGLANVAIRNGTIEFFFDDGIHAAQSKDLVLEGVRILGSGDDGVQCGERTIVRACAASGNFNYGFRTGSYSVIVDSTATENTTWSGFVTGTGTTLRGCTAHDNGHDGFSVGAYSTVENCTADSNDNHGFDTGNGTTISNSAASQNGVDGIHTNGPGSVARCTARSNTGDGIYAVFATQITDCASSENTEHGIQAGGEGNRVVGNTCRGNGLAGIHVPNLRSGNRIEGNNVTGNSIGIDIDGDENIIIANTANANNTNYSIGAGNAYGGIINVAGTGAFASDQPWANLAY